MINIETNTEEGICTIKVAGEVDASSSIHLDTAIGEAIDQHKKILVDFAELEYISSAGLGVFMSYLQQIESDQIEMVVFGMKTKVTEVFQILGLDQLMNITDTKEAALAIIKDA